MLSHGLVSQRAYGLWTTFQNYTPEQPKQKIQGLEPFHQHSTQQSQSSAPLALYLQPATPRDIVARMLRNLKEVHHAQQDWLRLLAVQERLVCLLPTVWSEWRDRGLVHAQCGHLEAAAMDLEKYVAHCADEPDCERMQTILAELRS